MSALFSLIFIGSYICFVVSNTTYTNTSISPHTYSILCSERGTAILHRLIEIVIDILVIIVVVAVVVVVATSMDHPTVVVGGEEEVVHHPWIITEVSESNMFCLE